MGGLALGNALIARFAHRLRRPLHAYAALECAIAVAGVALTYTLPELTQLGVATAGVTGDDWLFHAVRLLAAFVVLSVPATAMGATLPMLVGGLCRTREDFGRVLGRLYGWNTLGAVAGALAVEIVLIPRLGITGSAWFAALLDLGAAGIALWWARGAEATPPVFDRALHISPPSSRRAWRALTCAFLAGGTLLALEVVWFRFLSMFVLNSTLAVSVMLASVLAAIGIGGLVASTWLRAQPNAPAYVAPVALAAGCATALSYEGFQFLTAGTQTAEWYRILWFACALTVPTALLSGVLFPLLGETLRRHLPGEVRTAGWLTLANTTGAMCGPLVATFVLLPALGMERAFFALTATYAAMALLSISPSRHLLSGASGRLTAVAALAAVVVATRFPFGLMNGAYFPRSARPYEADGSRIVATREGSTETIFLMAQEWLGRPTYQRLVTNGFSMSATDLAGARYMRYFVYWPMLLHHSPLRRVLVISYGVGRTAGAATDVDSVESIDVVDISRDVVAMSDAIYPPDEHPLRDRRVRLHIEDGRHFLQTTNERFDLITGEPPPPLTPGTVTLYTREFFELMRDRLADGGMATYWLPVARRGEYELTPIIRSFCEAFEDCSLWNGTVFDWMLVGTRDAQGPRPEARFSEAWNHPTLAPRLREIGFEQPEQVGATFLGDADYLRTLAAEAPSLTDDFPHVLLPGFTRSLRSDSSRWFDQALQLFRSAVDTDRAQRAFATSPLIRRLWPDALAARTLPFFEHQRIINRLMAEGANPLRHIEELHALLTKTGLRRLPLWELGSNDVVQRIADERNDGTGRAEYMLGVRGLVARDYRGAADYFAAAERRGLRVATTRPLRAYALSLAGDVDAARQLAPIADVASSDERHFWSWMKAQFGIVSPLD
jgi:predicted membrane-bound spermidine synthase